MNENVTLVDGVLMHRDYPETFSIPTEKQKREVAAGDLVRVCVALIGEGLPAERIWIRVKSIHQSQLTGALNHALAFKDYGLVKGDQIHFEARHILDIVTVEQQNRERAEAFGKLHPLTNFVEIPDDPEQGVDLDVEDFRRVALSSIPEGLPLFVTGDEFPEVTMVRTGGQIEVEVSESFNPRTWEHTYSLRTFCQAMVNAAKILIADGHPLSSPTLEDGDYMEVRWKMSLPVTALPREVVEAIVDTYNAIWDGAEDLLP